MLTLPSFVNHITLDVLWPVNRVRVETVTELYVNFALLFQDE